MTSPDMSGEEIMQAAVENLERTVTAAEDGTVSEETRDKVADTTMRTIAEVAFGECNISEGLCKFYGQGGLSICDRSCDISVWDQI